MLSSEFAEDVFVEFYNLISQLKISVQGQDFSPIASFHEKIINGNELTKNQASFLIKLLEKYKIMSAMAGFDYTAFNCKISNGVEDSVCLISAKKSM
jgi:hypothetical protein